MWSFGSSGETVELPYIRLGCCFLIPLVMFCCYDYIVSATDDDNVSVWWRIICIYILSRKLIV